MVTRLAEHDNGYRALVKRVFGFERARVAAGILAAEGDEPKRESHGAEGEELTLIQVAVWQEFGTTSADGQERIPARSFIRAWFDENEAQMRGLLHDLMVSVVAGKRTKEDALDLLGQWAVGQIQARIARGIPPPLAQSTIDRKGSSVPLIDTGQLRGGVSYRVEHGARGGGS